MSFKGRFKKMSLWLTVLVAAALLVPLFGAGAASAADKVYRMKYDFYNVEKCEPAVVDRWALDEVMKRSKGKIKVKYYWMGALHKTGEHWAAVRDGLSEISFINFGYYMPQTPISRGVEWSWKKGAYHPDVHMRMMNKLYEEFPEWQKEFESQNMKVLWFTNWGPALFSFKKPYLTVDSLKGLRIRSYGVAADALKALDAVPVPIAAPEIYTSLQRGMIDGLLMIPVGFIWATHLERIVPDVVEAGYGVCGPSAVVMNKKLWDSLPADLKKIFMDVRAELINGKWNQIMQTFEHKAVDNLVKKGAKFYKWNDAEIAKANKIVQPAEVDSWIAEMNGLGFKRAKEFQERATQLLQEMGPSTFIGPYEYYQKKYGKK
ncbi:MAG: TRAP transporter substrate-binding protein DctP [Desulfarculaceae bacterium]|nr:TRAP transporter substrate-binding protein DctP [Desulfarculaceae bacterium]MCF8072438.1 TRAP transporter substrate-binding protein DctP [Desulfarculaceae bacterium]MCF8102899.1 TRAP transporter substrate-binding protein DctP [Desulfarculaceae bacterium]MCF8118481.1 TRAP transporter substrate-binding protein DctP [Desulfarculaceae bacterium]